MSHPRTRRRAARAATALVVVLLTGSTAATTAATSTTPATTTAGGPTTTVTLVTGDRVVLDRGRVVAVRPGAGRGGVSFHAFHRADHVHVVPGDAARPLAQDRLDPRLFDVTGLVEAGYDDARRDSVPLVVARGDDFTATAVPKTGTPKTGTPKTGAVPVFQGLLTDPGVRKVWLDGVRRVLLDRSTAQVGAPAAWAAGHTGAGVRVAVLDTGVDGDHPDLAGREVAERNFSAEPDAVDRAGHGTHVAATIAGGGARYRGVAPDARILDGKVCEASGGCRESAVLAGMEWAVEQGADVVNLSLGYQDSPGVDPLEEAVNALSARTGALFVVAAGNAGPAPGGVTSPGSADAALTVGAVGRDDALAHFSSRGPRVGDGAVKPDLTAPGVDIVAAEAGGDGHLAMSGTSMATPHVAGAAALIAQQHPDWTGARIKAVLTASAEPNADLTAFEQGSGRLDLARAITTTLTTDPVAVDLGVQLWPHEDDAPVTRRYTYRNAGDAPVTLALAVRARGPDGTPAPAGMFAVTPTALTVPAGGEAAASVTADTRLGALGGAYSGAVVATGGDEPLRTPVAVDREAESYDTTFAHLDRSGGPEDEYHTYVIGLSNQRTATLSAGRDTVRLPAGSYFVVSELWTDGQLSLLVRPDLAVTATSTVTLDARGAKPLRVTAPDPAAEPLLGSVQLSRRLGGRPGDLTGIAGIYPGGFPAGTTIGHVGPELSEDEVSTVIGAEFAAPPVGSTPVHHRFAWEVLGHVPTGFERAPAARDLARVRTSFGPALPGKVHLHGLAMDDSSGIGGISWLTGAPPSGTAVDYVTTDGNPWRRAFFQDGEALSETGLFSGAERYRAGRTYDRSSNHPVFGPALPPARYPYLSRAGDLVDIGLPLFGDGQGNRGFSLTSSARTALYRDGELVGESDNPTFATFPVPPGPADYRLEVGADRAPGISEFATRVGLSWTFRSGTVPGNGYRALPLSVVRFTPRLDASGAAPAGGVLRVPLVVDRQEGPDRVDLRRFRVEVSFDDGGRWSPVPVAGSTALVRNGAAKGAYASLRVAATDGRGRELRQTVIRAYRLG
ncbi:S8 family serine peptidase [Saccharothrix sp. BKS2]|uniref:S8 family peptidase n=1 Tax=Saccharothrix sp. BKS2 TaxID=3064400 RepID=UPI0039E94A78